MPANEFTHMTRHDLEDELRLARREITELENYEQAYHEETQKLDALRAAGEQLLKTERQQNKAWHEFMLAIEASR